MDVTQHLGLVVHVARQRHTYLQTRGVRLELDDLIQEGFVGLMEAAVHYDSERGVPFASYAYPRIQGAISDYLRRLDAIGQQQRDSIRRLEQTRERLAQALGREPSVEEIDAALGLAPGDLRSPRWVAEGLGVTSPGSAAAQQESNLLPEDLDKCLHSCLDPVERRVVLLRVWEECPLRVVAQILGRPLQTVHNIEVRARRKLGACMEARGWDLADVER